MPEGEKNEILVKRAKFSSPHGDEEFPTVLRLDNDTSSKHTLLHVQTPDHIGLLFDITSCFVEFNLVIYHSRITTEKGAALDTFYLSPRGGGKIENSETQRKLLDSLQKVLSPSVP